jgi:hypothetical protein
MKNSLSLIVKAVRFRLRLSYIYNIGRRYNSYPFVWQPKPTLVGVYSRVYDWWNMGDIYYITL